MTESRSRVGKLALSAERIGTTASKRIEGHQASGTLRPFDCEFPTDLR